jgi:hypothetical protein
MTQHVRVVAGGDQTLPHQQRQHSLDHSLMPDRSARRDVRDGECRPRRHRSGSS